MISKILNRPQLLSAIIGGWLVLFGLSGMMSSSGAEPVIIKNSNTETSRLKVVPANQQPGSVGGELQGAQGLQQQGDGLQNQSGSDLQPNSGLSDFPNTAGQLQQ